MKRQILFLLLMTILSSVCAQDVIVKKDGSTIISKILEVNTTDVKYKKVSNLDGPTYTINTSDILSINYENGEKETFENAASGNAAKGSTNSPQGYIEKPADARNAEILALYNKEYTASEKLQKKEKDSPAKYWSFILGVKSSSVMSNEDIEMTFKRETVKDSKGFPSNVYYINLKNKTDRTIYIDKGRSFRIDADGKSMCYYEDTEQTTVSVGGGSGASLGLGSVAGALGVGGVVGQIAGGIGIGGGTNHSVSTTFQKQRFIAIPPHGTRSLTEDKKVQTQKGNLIKDDEYQQVEKAEEFEVTYEECGLNRGFVNVGEVKVLAEDEVPWNMEYIVTYSTEEDLSTYSSLKTTLYLHEVVGGRLGVMDATPYEQETKMDEYIEGVTPHTIRTRVYVSEKAK